MLYRNLLAMDAEELLRGHPVDGVVLMGGCDKTTPALLLGAISTGLPTIYLPAGPMLRGNWKGKTLGSGSDAGSTGTNAAPARFPTPTGSTSRPALRAPMAPA